MVTKEERDVKIEFQNARPAIFAVSFFTSIGTTTNNDNDKRPLNVQTSSLFVFLQPTNTIISHT
jgi:hypothetical protein